MDEALARHLVHQCRRAQRVLHAGCIAGVDGRADVAQRGGAAGFASATVLAAFDVLTMSLQRES